ncbi:MAG: hypothetical protein ACW98D_09210 [Promethearchaeota archaeon]
MEPYSADDIKRKKRKNDDTVEDVVTHTSDYKLITPFTVAFREEVGYYIYDGKEKTPFKQRDPQYQKILRDEFE